MAGLSLIFDPSVIEFVATFLPFKGTIPSLLCFLLFTQVDNAYLQWYQVVIDLFITAYMIFEMTQITNLAFKISRFFSKRVDFDKGYLQVPVLATILICLLCLGAMLKTIVQDIPVLVYDNTAEAPWFSIVGLIITVLGLIALPLIIEGYDSNIMNGFLVATYISWSAL